MIKQTLAAVLLAGPIGWLGATLGDNVTDITVGVLLFIPAFLTALAVLRRSRRAEEKIEDSLDTGNDRTVGTIVHDMSQTMEAVVAQTHANTTTLHEHIETSRLTHEEIYQRLEEIKGLVQNEGGAA